ncbi:MAG: hypothetical protein WCG01_02210 [bacterium]
MRNLNCPQLKKQLDELKFRIDDINESIQTASTCDHADKINGKMMFLEFLITDLRELLPFGFEIRKGEAMALEKFFGEKIEVSFLPKEITQDKLEQWKQLGLDLHYLPEINMNKSAKYPGWRKKPHSGAFGMWDMINKGTFPKDITQLKSGWFLIENIKKPWRISMGETQEYEDDLLAAIISGLKSKGVVDEAAIAESSKTGKIKKESRCSITLDELEDERTKKEFASIFAVSPECIDYPRAIEFNVLANMYYPQLGQANSSEHCSDRGQDGKTFKFVFGATRDIDQVDSFSASDRSTGVGFRVMIRLNQ